MYQRAEGTLRAGGSLLRTRLSCDPAPVPARVPEPPRPAPSHAHRPALRAAGRCRRRPGKTLPRRFSVKTSLPRTRTPRKHDRGEQRLPLAPGKPASWFRAGRDPGPQRAVAARPPGPGFLPGALRRGSLVTSRWQGRDKGHFAQARGCSGEPPAHSAGSPERGEPQRRPRPCVTLTSRAALCPSVRPR